jgi:hypothetical protein
MHFSLIESNWFHLVQYNFREFRQVHVRTVDNNCSIKWSPTARTVVGTACISRCNLIQRTSQQLGLQCLQQKSFQFRRAGTSQIFSLYVEHDFHFWKHRISGIFQQVVIFTVAVEGVVGQENCCECGIAVRERIFVVA